MCDEQIRLSNLSSAANTATALQAANRALLDHLAECPECIERRRLELAAVRRMIEIIGRDEVRS